MTTVLINAVCLAQSLAIYNIVTCDVLSETERLSKEQKAIFVQRKLLLDEDWHALSSVSNHLKTKKFNIKI